MPPTPFPLGYPIQGPIPTPPALGPFQGMPGSWMPYTPPPPLYPTPIGPRPPIYIPPVRNFAKGLMTPAELASQVASIQSMVTPAPSAGVGAAGTVAPNLISRLAGPLTRTAANPGPWAGASGLAGKVALGAKGLGYGIAGELGSMGIKAAIPGSNKAEQVLSGAARGAALGAGVGAIGLPIPIVGALTTGGGAAIGGVLGGLGGLLFGDKKKGPPTINLAQLYQQANLDPNTAAQFDRYYKVLTTIDGSKKGRDAARGTIANLVLQQVAQQQANPVRTMTPQEMAAMQAQTAAFLKPYTDQSIETARFARDNTLSQLSNVPEQYRGVLSAGANNQYAAATRLANAYAAQAQLAPQSMAIQQQQQQQQALAAQIQQQALAAQLAGTSGGYGAGEVDFSQLGG